MSAPVQPTPEEIKNGWTAESLAKYLAEREAQQAAYALEQEKRKTRPVKSENVKQFDPHKWGG